MDTCRRSDSITGEYSVGIPNNMTSIDIKAIANRSDIISLLVGENTADEGEDGEDTDTSETPDTPSERSWIETLKLDLDTSVYPLVYNGTNVDKDSGERIKIGQAIDPDSQTTVVKIYLYADNGTMITNEDAPIILNINKKSEDANISSVTINPDTVYENSDSTERLDENQIPGFTVFANEDLDNPEKESYTEAFTVKLSSPKAKLTIDSSKAEYEPDADGNVSFSLNLVERDENNRNIFHVPVTVTAEAGNTKKYILNVELHTLDIGIVDLKYNNASTSYDSEKRNYYVFEEKNTNSVCCILCQQTEQRLRLIPNQIIIVQNQIQ